MQIISADERLRECRGAKVLILGPTGVGKTSLLRTLSEEVLASTLLINIEAGDLAIQDLLVQEVRIEDWQTFVDLVCRLSGPNKSFPPTMPYSQAHFEAVGGALNGFTHIAVDSLTALTRLSFRHAEQLPESFSERTGRKDVRSAYGAHARQLLLALNQLQHIREMHVTLIGILEKVVDEFKQVEWQLQAEGSKTSRELPGIIDEVITYQFLDFGDGKPPIRGFVCTSPNPWGYPAKDRSGRLDQIEAPDLGKLLSKLINKAKEGLKL